MRVARAFWTRIMSSEEGEGEKERREINGMKERNRDWLLNDVDLFDRAKE